MSRTSFAKAGVLLPLVLFVFVSPLFAAAVKLSTISVSPNSFTGGNGSPTCTVTLTAAAGNHGAAVTVTSSNTAAVASTTITVPQGQTTASVLLTTSSIQSNANVTLTASMSGSTNVATTVTVRAPVMSGIICSPSQVLAPGGIETVTVQLNVNAPPGGTVVSLSSTSSAAPVPASVTIPAGNNAAQFTITPQQVSVNTPVTISASAYGSSVQASFVIIPACSLATQPQPTIPPGDHVWVDDTSGGLNPPDGGVYWDTTQSASGTQSLTRPAVGPGTLTDFAFALPTATTINSGDSFVVYVLLDPCAPPATVGFTWSESAIGRVRGAYWGQTNAQWDSTGWWTHVGPLPAAGSWARLTFESPIMAGGTVDVSNTFQIGGKAWYDHYGTFNAGCTLATQPKPTIPAGDQVWVDDTAPGLNPPDGGVYWDTAQAASGTQSLTRPAVGPATLTDFAFALPTATTINSGDSFVVYVLLDPCAPPATVGFTWSESAIGRVRGAYWGQTNPQWDSTGWWTHVGPLPAAGSWARLTFESPIMVGGTVDVSNTFQIGGKAWYDHYGIVNAGSSCTLATQPQPSIPAGDHVWVDDTSGGLNPPGGVYWDTTQAASGIQSLTMAAVGPTTETDFAFALPTATAINSGDSFVMYVLLDPCAPPATVGFTWSESAIGRVRGAYWGQTNPQWDSSGIWTHVGPLPAAGSWARLTFNSPEMAGGTVDVSNTFWIGGKAWFDHYGTFNAGCTLATQPQPSIPPGDNVWVDDTSGGLNPPDGGVYWDTTQSASGTQSLTRPAVGPGTLTDFAFALPTATTINSGDSFVVYVLLDPCAPPATVGFTWSESAIGRVRGAYWGQTNAQWDSTGWWTHVGPLPAAGSWARLTFESPIMAGGTVDVSNTFQIGGKAWYDHYGTFNAGSSCTLATQPQPSIPPGDQVWVDDTSGGNSPEVSWDATQSASGTLSLTMPALGPTTYSGFAFGLPTATAINAGDIFVAYVLIDPCNPPATVGFTWSESAIGRVRGAYWGQTYAQWDSSGIWTHVGPLPAAGSWARLTFESPIMAGGTVDVSNTYQIGGKAWYDHYGTFQP